MSSATQKINLLNFNSTDLAAFFVEHGEKPFRAQQLIKWIHQLGVTDFSLMTNLSLVLREYLIANTEVRAPRIVAEQKSTDGTRKWLLELDDGNKIETVLIPEDDRVTLCVSTQVGCPIGCAFCFTGKLGFKRNLEIWEIIGQLWLAVRALSPDGTSKTHAVTNVVLMGMGEPLLNFENVVKAVDLMLDDLAYGLSKYRVTISTAGIVPAMERLRELSKASLAISLHAPNDELRSQIMPINKKYPLRELIAACKQYYQNEPKRVVTIEYIMLAGVNDSVAQAKELVKLLHGLPCKVNLIPYNAGDVSNLPGAISYRASAQEVIDSFRNVLLAAGINTITRKSRGADIAAACGQLVAKKSD
jgi:23S rRNA (adenine2503-C2)-methyltransferase